MEQVALIIGLGKAQRGYELLLRLGIFGTFLGHGIFALNVKQEWIRLITQFGFSVETAIMLLPLIGFMDIVVAFFALLRPMKVILLWSTIWAFATALSRFTAGDVVWECVERAANWVAPLSLLLMQGFPKKIRDLFVVR